MTNETTKASSIKERETSQVSNESIRNLTPNDDVFNQDSDSGQAVAQPETINALAGDDEVTTSSLGGSLVNGQPGRDTLVGQGPGDTLVGNGGSDSIEVNGAGSFGFGDNLPTQIDDIDNTNFGPAANDTLQANQRARLYGGAGNDFLRGISGLNWFSGNQGNDLIVGGFQARDSMYGGKGSDSMGFFGPEVVNLLSLQGLPASSTEEGNNFLSGNSGADLLAGAGNRDSIYGGKDNDTVAGIGNQVYLSGDRGNDTVVHLNRTAQVAFSSQDAIRTSERSTLVGGEGNDSLRGPIGNFGDGRNSLSGGAGDDIIEGWASRDTLKGDAGNDFIAVGLPDESLEGLVNQNGVPLSSTNYFGQNRLDGGEGNDTLVAGSVSDEMIGGVGNDCLTGIFNEANGGLGNDVIDASQMPTNFSGTNVAPTQVTLIGGAGNDNLIGNSNDGFTNFFNGGTGNDTITFGSESDEVIGDDRGDDLIGASGVSFGTGVDFSSGVDGISIADSQGNNTLLGSLANDTLVTGGGDDSLRGGAGNDSIIAGGGDDILFGGTGTDTLIGGAGNDTLYGGPGNADRLTGGAGQDRFGLIGPLTNGTNVEIITDFDPADDLIQIDGNAPAFEAAGNGIVIRTFGAGVDATLSNNAPTIIYERNPDGEDGNPVGVGVLSYDSNGSDEGGKVQIARLLPDSDGVIPDLAQSDIIII